MTSHTVDTIRAEMARRRLSNKALAEHLGMSQVGVSRRLSGKQSLTVDELAGIAEFLDVPVGDLLPPSAPKQVEA